MRLCSVEGCDSPIKGHSLCDKHLRKLRKYGNPLAGKVHDGFTKLHPRESNSWHCMKQRCINRNAAGYKNYGGRGISICDRWLDKNNGFRNFYQDMGERPAGTSLDRIDSNKGYYPENCRWADNKTQGANRRGTSIISYMGEEHTLKEWSVKLGLNYGMLVMRHSRYKWTGDKLFSEPRKYSKIKI